MFAFEMYHDLETWVRGHWKLHHLIDRVRWKCPASQKPGSQYTCLYSSKFFTIDSVSICHTQLAVTCVVREIREVFDVRFGLGIFPD